MDLLNTYMRSRGDYSPSLLKRTGTGGVRGSAGLSDDPLYAYLDEGELPHYVFASAGTPDIAVNGEPLDHRFGKYATMLVATDDRILCVAGGPDGDTTIDVPYTELETVDATTGRRKLSKQTKLTIETADTEITFRTKDTGAIPAARTFVDERVADAHLERARQKREAGARRREEDGVSADAELAEAADSAQRAVDWAPAGSTTMADGLDLVEAIDDEPIEPPETDDDPDRDADADSVSDSAELEDAPEPANADTRTTLKTKEPLTRAGDYDHIPTQGSVSGAIDALAESQVEPLDVTATEPAEDSETDADSAPEPPADRDVEPEPRGATSADMDAARASDLADPSGTVAGESTAPSAAGDDRSSTAAESASDSLDASEAAAESGRDAVPERYRRSYETVRDAYHAHEQFERAKIAGDVEEAKAHLQDARDAYETYLDERAVAPIEVDVDDLPGDSRALPPETDIERRLTELPEIPPREPIEGVSVAGTSTPTTLEKSTDGLAGDALDAEAEPGAEPEPEPTATVEDDAATDAAEPEVNDEPELDAEPDAEATTEDDASSPDAERTYEESGRLAEVRDELAALHEAKGDVLEETDLVESDVTVADCIEAYGSWTEAVEAAGCEPRPRLLGELQRVSLGLGEIPTREQMNAHGRYDATLYDRYFDSWADAKTELDAWTPDSTDDPEPNPEPKSLEARLADALRELRAEKGRVPTRSDVMHDCPHSILRFNREFGSLDDALDAAGVTAEPVE
ncbi:homing endonuclease associated repeat-containing protein [Halocalculus aciditolerans]|uniref:YokE-like PH domain-containing protein n=1 Tax=Halocalculus aciditolerans TaxID=1383812 RepID=A0A830F923_9EURY|nr:PH domain-containing protein [Halocalculus aciditolerans]GGL66618.1 hypothetical protein GCM10009039_25720 [Halocalculus aciditolerans]